MNLYDLPSRELKGPGSVGTNALVEGGLGGVPRRVKSHSVTVSLGSGWLLRVTTSSKTVLFHEHPDSSYIYTRQWTP